MDSLNTLYARAGNSVAKAGFLQTNLFIAPAEKRRDRAPNERGTDAERHGPAESEASRPQSRLRPRRANITESVNYGIDDILGFVPTALFQDSEADFPRWSGDCVLPDATHDLQRLNHEY